MKTPYILLLAVALTACSGGKDKGPAAMGAEDETPKVETDVAFVDEVTHQRQYTATIEAENVNNISPQQANRITDIRVQPGDRVTKGQVLVTLDHANIDQAQTRLAAAQTRLNSAQREYDRARQLLTIGSGTQQTVDQMKTELDAARSDVDNIRSQIANLRENAQLVSPITGVVTARNYDPGDMTGSQPVLSIGQLTPTVKAMINISETDMAQVRKGQPVTLTFDAFPGETFNATITRLYPQVDANTRTFPAEVAVSNASGKILPGMFGRVAITLERRQSIVVPDRAVVKQTGSGQHYVFTYSGGRVHYKNVELGERTGTLYEIVSGLQDGDTVVITGQSRLADGKQVERIQPKS